MKWRVGKDEDNCHPFSMIIRVKTGNVLGYCTNVSWSSYTTKSQYGKRSNSLSSHLNEFVDTAYLNSMGLADQFILSIFQY